MDAFIQRHGFLMKRDEQDGNPTYSKGRREASFHPSVPSSIHSSVGSSIRPVMVCLLRRGGERVEYRRAQRRIIYINVVNFFYFFYFGVFGLRYTHPVSFSTTERVGLGFSFFFFEILFRILKIFNAFYIAIIFITVQWVLERAAVKHTFIRYSQFQSLHFP